MSTGMSRAIEAVWQSSRGEIARRIATLEQAVAAIRAGALGEDMRAAAQSDAHKLAGSLGMFGFPTGSQLARELEQALRSGGPHATGDVPRLAELVLALRADVAPRMRGGPASDDAA